ncbi:acetate/propionate family kinase [Desulfoferula mesophila]|uniref:Acetate kinase n=1 Tax=Desulfoferula mesophila TaxID=3058419 RepID=A0AAU9ET37_9BACT|nr:acetate kinase [Desulfoferula mesophilus]
MIVLVINAGSSSVKLTCFDSEGFRVLAKGLVERVGQDGTTLHLWASGQATLCRPIQVTDIRRAVELLLARLVDPEEGVLSSLAQIGAVGHRVVHGGDSVTQPVLLNENTTNIIRRWSALAPLHNPHGLAGIEAAELSLPHAVHVVVFDTAFHAKMPPVAYLYPLPRELYERDKIRRYGFHGTSHQYVYLQALEHLPGPPESRRVVTCHLGNGCSMAAITGGRSLDTSMGFTPLEGLMMGTRCGDLDPAIIVYLQERHGITPAQVNDLLNKQSGLAALSGVASGDLRDIVEAMDQGDHHALQALQIFAYRIKKYLGSYAAVLGGLDAVVFTAGIGENSPLIRRLACQGLEFLGIDLDDSLNDAPGKGLREIQAPGAAVKLLVIPTDEELAIAQQTVHLIQPNLNAAGRYAWLTAQ